MRPVATSRLLALVAILVLSGCAAPLVILPNDVGEQGLLVGQVSSQTMPQILDGDPTISGRKFIGGLRGGTMIVALLPGEYELAGFDETTGSTSLSTPYGTHSTRYYRWYPVGHKFKIEAGKATNLGTLVFENLPRAGLTARSKPLYVDNAKEIEVFLQERHPRMYNSLQGEKIVNDTNAYLHPDQLGRLRHHLALQKASTPRWQKEHGDGGYVTATLGTIAAVRKAPNGGFEIKQPLATGTVSDLSHCSVAGARVACVMSGQAYLLVENDTVKQKTAPEGVTVNTVLVFGERGLVIVDDHMRFHTTVDDGKNWHVFTEASLPKPIKRGSYNPIAMNSIEFVAGQDGFYAFKRRADGNSGHLVYADYASASYRVIPFPKNAKNIKVLREVDEGLYLGPSHTDFAKGRIYFLAAGDTAWQERILPRAACHDMLVGDRAGRHLQILCGRDDVHASEDGGLTWAPMFKAKSLFHE